MLIPEFDLDLNLDLDLDLDSELDLDLDLDSELNLDFNLELNLDLDLDYDLGLVDCRQLLDRGGQYHRPELKLLRGQRLRQPHRNTY